MQIVVLMGGDSSEREISLASGAAIAKALAERDHQVEAVTLENVAAVMELPCVRQADVVFPALHGGDGEDGHLQALLDLMQIPYALSGPLASSLAMNKAAAKRMMRGAGIPTPQSLLVTWDQLTGSPRTLVSTHDQPPLPRGELCTVEHVRQRVESELGFPLVMKPNEAGSSVNIEIVEDPSLFETAFTSMAETRQNVLLERYIPGRELTAAIFLGRRLPLLEITPRDGFYDYGNKYTPGASEYQVPAPLHSPLYEQVSDDALRLFDLLDCRGLARIDFRVDGDDYYCLELNTIPGMTDTSLVPMAAAAVGIEFGALLEDLCQAARLIQPARNLSQSADTA
ncbi:MAG: D-alanine--D-alanine ligase [bacterium]